MIRIPARARRVTQEPQVIAEGLLDAPLGSFRRRLSAFALDAALFGLCAGLVFSGLSLLSFHRADPTLLPRLRDASALPDSARAVLLTDFLAELAVREPDALPADMVRMMETGDLAGLREIYGGERGVVGLTSGRTRFVHDEDGWTLAVGPRLMLGRFAGFFGWGAAFTVWFTVWTRLGRGRTPGKRLLGLEVVRLDGRGLRWWDAFGRAGGYSASTATLLLGFVEAAWHPNRQAMHDRIAGTVVIRAPRRS